MSRVSAVTQTLAVSALLALAAPLAARPAAAQSEQQALVDRATLAVQEIVGPADARDQKSQLRQARAVMVCPRVFKVSFFLGGEGGGCVLVARDGGGSWSYPSFYGMTSGSLGLQVGIQDSEFIMMILTEKGLHAVLDSQFKLGGDVSIAIADMGAGVEGSTTAAVGADIVAFSKTRGLFAGASLQGSLMSVRSDWNKAYYGQDLAARNIVIGMQGTNQGADPLREVLTRVAAAPAGLAPPQPVGTPEKLAPLSAPPERGQVQQQNLAPPGPAPAPTGAPQTLQLPKRQ
jgi:lipid-binding SYLF domain-containing protein